MNKKVDINTGKLFPAAFIFFGVLLAGIGGWLLLTGNVVFGLLLLPVSLVLTTSRYGLEIDVSERFYNEYIQIAGVRRNNRKKYTTADRLYVKQGNVSQTMTSYGGSVSTLREKIYSGYLVFSDHEKLHILDSGNKDKLLKKLEPVARALDIHITDYSEDTGNSER